MAHSRVGANTQINCGCPHVIALANTAVDEVRRKEMRTYAAEVRRELGTTDRKVLRGLALGMRKNSHNWSYK